MLKHFLSHYIQLGIMPSRIYVFVFGGKHPNAVLHYLHLQGAIQSQVVMQRYNDSYRLSMVNALLRKLPPRAWITTPDVDELYHYPCNVLPKLITAHNIDLFCGIMEDMLGKSGGIEQLHLHPDIQTQYPHRCRVRSFLRHFNVYKIVLARVRPVSLGGNPRQFRSVHAFTTTAATNTSRDCHMPNRPLNANSTRVNVGPLSHYSLTREQVFHAINKAKQHKRNYDERIRLKTVENWGSCGSFAKDETNLTTPRCIDYERILKAMSLIYNYSRGQAVKIARLCHLPVTMRRPISSSSIPWNLFTRTA